MGKEGAQYMWELLQEFRDLWCMKGFENFSQANANHIVAKKLDELKTKVDVLEKELDDKDRKEIPLLRRTP